MRRVIHVVVGLFALLTASAVTAMDAQPETGHPLHGDFLADSAHVDCDDSSLSELLLHNEAGVSHEQPFVITKDADPEDVPEPGTLVIWSLLGAGAAVAGATRRRKAGRWSAASREAIRSIIDRRGG